MQTIIDWLKHRFTKSRYASDQAVYHFPRALTGIVEAALRIKATSFLIDGEVCDHQRRWHVGLPRGAEQEVGT